MKTLVMDTASKYLFFSFIENGQVLYEVMDEGKNNHSDNLLKKIELALIETNLSLKDFKRIVVGIGPGSYTGLRVSVTVAKMLAWTLGIDLYIVSSLSILSSGHFDNDGIYAVTIRAKKNHVYGKLVEVNGGIQKILINDMFSSDEVFFDMIKNYNYKLVNEENYKIKYENMLLEKVDNLHQLNPNYIQRGI
ncbi:MAG: tRNA (adenosine(37)-N6)-threonylcarbamoyltransferase complex dimerization subunit type 1 TsaB [Bacilli bacterium]